MDGAPSLDPLRSVAARQARSRNRGIEAERTATEWPEFAPQTSLGDGALGAAQAADRQIARLYAQRARALAEFCAARPASVDRAQGEPGAMSGDRWAVRPEVLRPVSEWATPEASIALTRSQTRAVGLLEESLALVTQLPGTLAALEGGLLTPEHLRPLLEHVAPIADAQLRAEIEAEVLRWVAARAARKTITVPGQLGERVLRVVTRRNARDAAQRAVKALRNRGVCRESVRGEGLAGLAVVGTVPEIEALYAALAALVDALPEEPGDGRTREQQMLDVLLDLVLRPGENGLPPVQVLLTLVASVQTVLGGDEPAELNGQIVSAETARQLLNALTGAGLGEEAVAELRQIAAGDDTHTEAGAGFDADPDDEPSVGLPVTDPFTPEEQALIELSAWFDDLPWRIAAGELDPEDCEPPDELLAAWPGDVDELFEEGLPDNYGDVEPDEDAEVHDVTAPTPPGSGTGWWGSADRAVADATAAQWEAERALARAGWLVRTAVRADAADQQAWNGSAAARVDAVEDAMGALRAATAADRAALGELLARTAGGGLADRPRLALVDALSGALVSLTDLARLRRVAHCGRPACTKRPERCHHELTGRPGLGAPPPTGGYRPGAALDRYVRLRDRRCRFPGCRKRVAKGELDHRIAWPDGPTDASNLAGLCSSDHRAKHQAPGLIMAMTADGTLAVTTASGITATTEPPPF